jgi:transposase
LNVLKPHLRVTIQTLLRNRASQHEIQRLTGVDRKTIRRYQRQIDALEPNSPRVATGSATEKTASSAVEIPPPRPPAGAVPPARSPKEARSACEAHREWIEAQVALGRNAQSIYQDLVEAHGFTHKYNSVKRFVRGLKVREPERFDVLESGPGEEAQVDFGQGAPTRLANGKYRRPWLFVMTLKYSGKAFRKVVWKADQESWARLHEEAFRTLGGASTYVVLDNLKQGVLRPDLYEPQLNPLYAAMLAHYGSVADVCRVRDPDRKGAVENAIQHTQNTALKGRKFESIEAQNEWLAHWEERWAAPRIHGRKKRQVCAMFVEERPHLKALPSERFRCFKQQTRTVDHAGLVQIEGSYYAASAPLYSPVTVRIYERDIEILDECGQLLRRHAKSTRKGTFVMAQEDRIFNPSRETARLIGKVGKIGPRAAQLAREIFARLGRPGEKAIYGLANLVRHHKRENIERACEQVLALAQPSYQALKRILERQAAAQPSVAPPSLQQAGSLIRSIEEYHAFFEQCVRGQAPAHDASTSSPTTGE